MSRDRNVRQVRASERCQFHVDGLMVEHKICIIYYPLYCDSASCKNMFVHLWHMQISMSILNFFHFSEGSGPNMGANERRLPHVAPSFHRRDCWGWHKGRTVFEHRWGDQTALAAYTPA